MARLASLHLSRAQGKTYLGNAPKRGRYTVASKDRRTIDGIVFDSLAESMHYGELKMRELIGEISDIQCQVALPIYINGGKLCVYTCDFSFRDASGALVYHEVKSNGTRRERDYKIRRKSAELYHGIRIVEIIR